jgi:hypothetical protein
MNNKAMQEKIQAGEAFDISSCPRDKKGGYIITAILKDMSYCDAKSEQWINFFYKNLKTHELIAFVDFKPYSPGKFRLLWIC